jgi:hypothetical protein
MILKQLQTAVRPILLACATLVYAGIVSARSEVVTWTFHAKVTAVYDRSQKVLTDIGGTLPVGSPVRYSITFDTSIPGQVIPGAFPSAFYPLFPGQFQTTVNFGPYQAASDNASSGGFLIQDDDSGHSAANDLLGDTSALVQTAGPSLSEDGFAPGIDCGFFLRSMVNSAVVGTSLPAEPFPISLAVVKAIDIRVSTIWHQYLVTAEMISASPCDLLQALQARVANSGLANGTANSLLAKLNSAERPMCDSNSANDAQAKGPLGAFLNELSAQRGKKIPATLADSLAQDAQAILGLL